MTEYYAVQVLAALRTIYTLPSHLFFSETGEDLGLLCHHALQFVRIVPQSFQNGGSDLSRGDSMRVLSFLQLRIAHEACYLSV